MSRRSLLFLVVSLTANLALGVTWWKQSGKGALTGVGDSEPVIKPERSPSEWQSLVDGATDEEFVARLRQEGFPPRVIREWLKWRIWKRFTDRSQMLGLDPPPVPYWRERNPIDDEEIKRRAKRAALAQEDTDKMRKLLGPDLYCLPGDDAYDKRELLYGDLSLEKIAGIEAINADYRGLFYTVEAPAYGTPFTEIRAQLKFLEGQKRADIARLLTPSEFEHYERRSSWTANSLQWDLGYFDATEAEYIAMYEVRRAFDERYGAQHLSRAEEERRRAAYSELEAAYKGALGPQRFDDFQLMSDHRFGELQRWVDENGLPVGHALEIMRILQDADEHHYALRKAREIDRNQRSPELKTLVAETARRIGGLVGEDKQEAFMQGAGHLLPDPSPAELQPVP